MPDGTPNYIGEVSSVFREKRHRHTRFGARAEEEWAAQNVTEADDTAEVQQWQTQAHLTLELHDDSLALFTQIGALGGDV